MFKKIGQLSTLTIYKVLSRFGQRPAPVSIFDQIDKAHKVLLCLPDNVNELHTELLTLEKFNHIFPKASITLLSNSNLEFKKSLLKNYQLMNYNQEEMTSLGQPPKNIKENILKNHFDIAIDLSIAFNYINTSLVWASQACLRIGFNHPKRDDLYNFLIRVNPEETLENSYQSLFRYLGAKQNN